MSDVLSFCSSSGFSSCSILVCMVWIFERRVVSRLWRAIVPCIFEASSSSLTTMTFFWHFAHHRSLFLSLKSGEAHAGHASCVSVAPWRSKSAMRLTSCSSLFLRDKF